MAMGGQVRRGAALVALLCFGQVACYNTYQIDTQELEKLESTVEQREVVTVYADCAGGLEAPTEPELEEPAEPVEPEATRGMPRTVVLAQNDVTSEEAPEVADDAGGEVPVAADDAEGEVPVAAEPARPGCVPVPVSTANSMRVLTREGDQLKVTPFNFILDQVQLVSPEYDLLIPRQQVLGAEVKEFSAWKTVATIGLVTAAAVGAFVAISVFAPEEEGFQ